MEDYKSTFKKNLTCMLLKSEMERKIVKQRNN